MLSNHLLNNITILPVVMIYLMLLCSGGVSNPLYLMLLIHIICLQDRGLLGASIFPMTSVEVPGGDLNSGGIMKTVYCGLGRPPC